MGEAFGGATAPGATTAPTPLVPCMHGPPPCTMIAGHIACGADGVPLPNDIICCPPTSVHWTMPCGVGTKQAAPIIEVCGEHTPT
mmetsp:Transcript_116475/g.161667  ORF Transcript_116475/g.161667 Transcript_116475/m.161667 type:complete len:85 (+) Transcript_116475:1487-1741(+)|eukprot:scaffold258424_cov37-Tisochrysis_lutea.AAC.4